MINHDLSDAELVELIADYLQMELAQAVPLGARLKFSYPDGSAVLIDGTKTPCKVLMEDGDADCVVALSMDTHLAMLRFQLDQNEAFRKGALKISGNISIALRLAPRVAKRLRLPDEEA